MDVPRILSIVETALHANQSEWMFLRELNPLKRRIGMRFSNEFYFVTPAGLLQSTEVPPDSGLIEVGTAASIEEWKAVLARHAGFFHYDPEARDYCVLIVPAPWRETPGPTWELAASMMRNQRRQFEESPPPAPAQQKIFFEG